MTHLNNQNTNISMFSYKQIWPCLVCIRHRKSFKGGHHAKIMMLVEEDHGPGRGWWSRQRMMILADDHDPDRRSWSWQISMFLLEQYDFVGKQRTTVQGPPWDHLRTIFAKFEDEFPIICGLIRGHFCMVRLQTIMERKTKKNKVICFTYFLLFFIFSIKFFQ